MSATKIEWADITINPVVGCSKCSPGCDNCYAERQAARLVHMPQTAAKYAGVVDTQGKWTGKISEPDYSMFERLPKTPKRVFLGSMTDLFFHGVNDYGRKALKTADGHLYEFAPDTMHVRIAHLLVQISRYPQHTFMILTKRPEAMGEALDLLLKCPIPNLWIGVTVCNQQEADKKIPVMLQTPAAKKFVSIEPMLGAVDLHNIYPESSKRPSQTCGTPWGHRVSALNGQINHGTHFDGRAEFGKLDWVICGGETGPKARPMHPDWVRNLRDQCSTAAVPFFFKGWGEWWPAERGRLYREKTLSYTDGQDMVRTGKCRADRLLDGIEYSEFPA